MFPLSAQNKFYIPLSSYVERHAKKTQVSISCLWLVSRPPKSGCFFGKFTVEQVLKSFLGRNNSQKPLAFGFCGSLPHDLEESIELRAIITWVLSL